MATPAASASSAGARISAAILIVAAVVSAVVAPQRLYLRACSRHLPLSELSGLALLCGAGLGVATVWLLWGAARQWLGGVERRWVAGAVVVSLPCHLLWLPGLSATGSRAAYLASLALIGLVVTLVLTVALVRRSIVSLRRTTIFFGITAASLLGSLVLSRVSHRPDLFFAASLLWGLFLVASLAGWGRLVNRLLLPGQQLDWGQRAAWGLAAAVATGGLLNLTWAISRTGVLLFLAAGAGFLGTGARSGSGRIRRLLQRTAEEPLVVLLVLVVVVLAAVQYAGSVTGAIDNVQARPAFDFHDDCQAYLVFPVKMLRLGSMGPEPFEARRMLSMGGQSFLQTLVLAALPMRALHLLDGGVALLIILGLVSGAACRHGIDLRLRLFLVLLVLAFPHLLMRGNTSSLLTGVLLLLSWYRLLADGVLPATPSWRTAVLIALTAASLCAVKSIFIPAAVALFFASTTLYLVAQRQWRSGLGEAALTVVLIALLVLPWMVSIYQSSGTLLYPVFGKGFYGGVFTDDFASISGDFEVSLLTYLRVVWKHLLRLLLVVLLVFFVRDPAPRRPAVSLALATVVTVVLLVVLGDPNLNRSLVRYGFVVSTAALLGLSLAACRGTRGEGSRPQITLAAAAGIAVGTLFMLHSQDAIRIMYDQMLQNVANGITNPEFVPQEERREMAQLEACLEEELPEGAAVLVSLRHPHLLDPSRWQVLIMSLPAMAGLPPGLPVDEGAEAVAEYLQERGIRYVAYGGFRAARALLDLTEDAIRKRYPRSKMRWVMLRYHHRYHRVIRELAASRRRLFDSGRIVLLDLATRPAGAEPGRGGLTTGGQDGKLEVRDSSPRSNREEP